ncbi:tRNA lysidine(34) synthetase TilS [Nocardioides daejeonensis]|uniref:tRNA lysidine(34) synthetase TilS n=1 Tax=Nocardioides daejeonensis TaxID=1046556 RepID=UPI000D74CBFA|nr:tRNA lysidine(34) synthetase TilS [Nocardioides daejeonensis]
MRLDPALAAARLGVRRVLAAGEPGDVIVVACSGGADSTALVAATVFEAHKLGQRVIGVTVDHGLQAGSADQAAATVALMAELGVDETLTATVRVDARGMGPEAAAREARYRVLEEVADRVGAWRVLLGHTRDDQAETVLLGLARGSGGRSVAGMRRRFGRFERPFLDLTRADTEAACAALGVTPWQDPHNEDPGYARVRVRRSVLPALERELGPGVAAALARTADLLRPDMELLDALADEALARIATPDGLPVPALAELPEALRTRVLRSAAVAAGAPGDELTYEHVVEVDRLVTDWRGQRWVDLPGLLRAQRLQPPRVGASGSPSAAYPVLRFTSTRAL